MHWIIEKVVDRPGFNDLAEVHHGNFIRDLGDNAEVVRDEEDSHVVLFLHSLQQVEDLSLGSHVESGCRFVGYEDAGISAHRHRDHCTLKLTAAESEWILVHPLVWVRYAYPRQPIDREIETFLLRQVGV